MSVAAVADADLERRFGGLRRLYGDAGYARLRGATVAVVGLGGVGSWAVEALARSGVAGLVLIDFDHVAESNINRQVQALSSTLGQAKGEALARRIADIHPGCRVSLVDEFVSPHNWPALLPQPVDGLIDACDQAAAKEALARWALTLAGRLPFVTVGAAGGKRHAEQVRVDDLAQATHDPLLAGLRQRLRKAGLMAAGGKPAALRSGIAAVYSTEPVQRPEGGCDVDGTLNCAGYGSGVTVTATFGMVAAGAMIERLLSRRGI